MNNSFDDRVGTSRPNTYPSHDGGRGGWYVAQGLKEVAKAIMEAAKIMKDRDQR